MARGDPNGDGDGEREGGTGRDGPRIHLGFVLSLGDALGGLLSGTSSRESGKRRLGRGPGIARRPGTARAGRPDRSPSEEREDDGGVDCHVETYREGGWLTVVADLPGVELADLSAGLGEETGDLVIQVDEAVVERVPVPFDPAEATAATFNNGVLEVRLRAAGERTA